MVILSSLSINQLENLAFGQQVMADAQSYYGAEVKLKKMVKAISASADVAEMPCQIGHVSQASLKLKTKEWWHEYGCQIDAGQYKLWYIVEPVTSDDCASSSGKINLHADYLRLTFNGEQQHILMQSNVVRLSVARQSCLNKLYKIDPGLQNLQILN
jgi:hypothetical protein